MLALRRAPRPRAEWHWNCPTNFRMAARRFSMSAIWQRFNNDRSWQMLLKNNFEEGLRATLIQDDHRTRKFDSRSHRPRFDCCAPAPHRRLFQQHRPGVDVGPNIQLQAPKLHQAADVSGAAPRLLRRCDACLIDDRREALTLAEHICSETFAAEPARLDAERGQPHLDLRLLADRGQVGDNLGDDGLVETGWADPAKC